MTKLLTVEEIKKLEFQEVVQINIGDYEFDDIKVCITDEYVVIDKADDEQYVVYCTIGARHYNYVIDYSTPEEEPSEEDEEEGIDEEIIEEESKEIEAPVEEEKKQTGFWGIKI